MSCPRKAFPHDKTFVYNGSKQSDRYTANVSGIAGSARVAVSDTMFMQGADPAEVRGVAGLADPARLPILAMIVGTLFLLLTPLTSSRSPNSRRINSSLTHMDEPDGLAKSLVKTIEYRAATPSSLAGC